MRIVVAVLVFVAGCRYDSPAGVGDGPMPCTESRPGCVCVDKVCVECTVGDETNCANTRPQCGANNVCRACRSNDECNDSGACLEDGSCANKSQVIYAAPNGVATAGCGKAPGQMECSLAQALAEVNAPRDVIRLAPGTYVVPSATVDGLDFSAKSATLVARGATLTRASPNGSIISVRAGQTLEIVGGTVQGPINTTDGIRCLDSKLLVHEVTIEGMTQSGIETSNCQLTVSRSTLRNNKGGGINMTNLAGVATITNNFVYRNGGAAAPFGGLGLKVAPGSRIELNTVADNTADANSGVAAGGIVCDGQGYDAPGNLVYRNVGGIGGLVQVIGTCTFRGSYQKDAAPGANEVGFENPAGATPSYRLTEASSIGTIRDGFDCNDIDFERDVRPSPSEAMGGKCDYGADEYREGQ